MMSSLIDQKDEEIAALKARIQELEKELAEWKAVEERVWERLKAAMEIES